MNGTDRRLRDWFEEEAAAPPPARLGDAVASATRDRRPKSALSARLTADWIGPGSGAEGVAPTSGHHGGARTLPRVRPSRVAMPLAGAMALAIVGAGAVFVAGGPGPSLPPGDPLAGLETEEVAPGVHRVVRDDAGHELATLGVIEIAVGRDGAVWMNGLGGLFRLREPGIADPEPSRGRTGLTVGPDGSVWSRGNFGAMPVRSFRSEGWLDHPGRPIDSFTVDPDGSVWGTRPDPSQPPGYGVVRLDGDRWVDVDLSGWPDDLRARPGMYAPGLVATADGSLWVTANVGSLEPREVLVRFDGSSWAVAPTPFDGYWIADGPDGSWVIVDRNVGQHDGETRIGRFADGSWTTAMVELPDVTEYWSEDMLPPIVASDGAVWFRVNLPDERGGRRHVFPEGCDGVARVVGSTWTHHLPGTCVRDMAAGPHGELWVATWEGDMQVQRPGDVHVILPSASDG